jgi:hypothetical protein
MWLPHFTSCHGLYKEVEITMIPWSQFEDFIEGEQKNLDFLASLQEQKTTLSHLP